MHYGSFSSTDRTTTTKVPVYELTAFLLQKQHGRSKTLTDKKTATYKTYKPLFLVPPQGFEPWTP